MDIIKCALQHFVGDFAKLLHAVHNFYEKVPIASEEWVSEYEKRQETQAEFERKLKDRYEGIQLVNLW